MKATAVLAALLCLAGCASGVKPAGASQSPPRSGSTALANGREIFLTGRDAEGLRMTAARPPLRPACAACHRVNGSGGVHLPGGAVSADLRHRALSSGPHPYTLALLERAISTGTDNDGKPLNRVMPRWRMPKRDLHDVAEDVLTQLK